MAIEIKVRCNKCLAGGLAAKYGKYRFKPHPCPIEDCDGVWEEWIPPKFVKINGVWELIPQKSKV